MVRRLSTARGDPMSAIRRWPEPGEVSHRGPAGRLEVQVDAGEPGRVTGQADEHGRLALSTQDRQPRVLGLDVHHDHGVHHRPGGDPFDPVVVVLGEQQHVVLERLRARDDAGDELHDHADVDVDAQRRHQREDLGALGGERAGAGVRVGSRARGRPARPGRGSRRRSVACRRTCRRRSTRRLPPPAPRRRSSPPRHPLVDPRPAHPSESKRRRNGGRHSPSWTASAQPFNVIPASKRFDAVPVL